QVANRQFLLDLVGQCKDMGVNAGIYSTKWDWDNVVGASWNELAELPLWWPFYTGDANLEYFEPFGGWKKPTIHQYLANVNGACSVGEVDLNWQ
ncbi:hypothetical protein PENTCL1PPCAC_13462, partial [Pristionchus entomophagus]